MTDTNHDQRIDFVWQDPELARKFLQGIRGGVPFAAEQLDVMLRVLRASEVRVQRFMDIGCGDGVIGRALLDHYPSTHGTFMDFSETMLEAVRARISDQAERTTIIQADFGTPQWLDAVAGNGPFDVIVSGFAIHHQTDARKRQLYDEIFSLLNRGGMFLHLEHVQANSSWAEQAFVDLMIDSLSAFHRQGGGQRTREEIATQYVQRKDWSANLLAPLETQCQWLRDIGYQGVDCFFKAFELTVFGGRKP